MVPPNLGVGAKIHGRAAPERSSSARTETQLLKFHNRLIHRKAFSGCSQHFSHHRITRGKEYIFHLHGFNDNHAFTGLHFLSQLYCHMNQQPRHGREHKLAHIWWRLVGHELV